ncbi:MAG TPA: hypothetical protein VFK74_00550 [Azospira sp.]|nr:hypothetical protein [Azospira sp.]
MTLVELIVSMVIISVGLVGVLSALNQAVRNSADPLIHKQMLAIAEEMMDEVLQKPLVAPAGSAGSINNCTRSTADAVADYGAYTDQPVCDLDGTQLPSLAGYSVSVSVDGGASLNGINNVSKITVTVKHAGEPDIALVGYRTGWAL